LSIPNTPWNRFVPLANVVVPTTPEPFAESPSTPAPLAVFDQIRHGLELVHEVLGLTPVVFGITSVDDTEIAAATKMMIPQSRPIALISIALLLKPENASRRKRLK